MTTQLHLISCIILLLTLTACTQPAAQPEAPAEPADPYTVSDKDDPFEIKNLVDLDDPRKIDQTVVVNGREYSNLDYVKLAKEAYYSNTNNNLFEISIITNVYGRVGDRDNSGDIRDINFQGNHIHTTASVISIDFLLRQ